MEVFLMSYPCKEFILSFIVAEIFVSSDEHDSRFRESSLQQLQIPDAALRRRRTGAKLQHSHFISVPFNLMYSLTLSTNVSANFRRCTERKVNRN
ncbi:hypothetical protein J6590_097435 [Homalodisca vitripennis]|nr:hypothetical protein J6590_048883 [Homalodisca vitripennis]KAG8319165.1 hypothetical protein J6590_097435 [Homalodisca vitripennis]